MGEYALINGKEEKIGTCNNMYYLKLSDLKTKTIQALPGNVNPKKEIAELWFKLPWDKAGVFDGPDVIIKDIEQNHNTIQVSSSTGLLVNLNCTPITRFPSKYSDKYISDIKDSIVYNLGRNGGIGGYKIVALGIRNIEDGCAPAVLIECKDCRAQWRFQFDFRKPEDQEEFKLMFSNFDVEFYDRIRKEFNYYSLELPKIKLIKAGFKDNKGREVYKRDTTDREYYSIENGKAYFHYDNLNISDSPENCDFEIGE